MYVMYVDESGDPGPYNGQNNGNSRHFILSGLIVPMAEWNECFDRIKQFRQQIRKDYGLPLREELHAAELIRINKIDAYRSISKCDRIRILISFVKELAVMVPCGKVINVCLHKSAYPPDTNFKEKAWSRLIQRYSTFMLKDNKSNRGFLVADGIEDNEIRTLLRKMRVYNPIPSQYDSGYYNRPTFNIIDDPFSRNSKHSYFVQAADIIAHALYRKEYPKGSLKKHGLDKCFDYLDAILLKDAAGKDAQGIVRK